MPGWMGQTVRVFAQIRSHVAATENAEQLWQAKLAGSIKLLHLDRNHIRPSEHPGCRQLLSP